MSEVTELTQAEALAQGYKYCGKQYGEHIVRVENCDFRGNYILFDKEPQPYQISDNLIEELISDHLDAQDEVFDEDGDLNKAIATVDYSDITKKVNEALAGSVKFYRPTTIRLMPNVRD